MRLPSVLFNVRRMMILALGVPATAAALVAALLLSPTQAAPPGGLCLLETLSKCNSVAFHPALDQWKRDAAD